MPIGPSGTNIHTKLFLGNLAKPKGLQYSDGIDIGVYPTSRSRISFGSWPSFVLLLFVTIGEHTPFIVHAVSPISHFFNPNAVIFAVAFKRCKIYLYVRAFWLK